MQTSKMVPYPVVRRVTIHLKIVFIARCAVIMQ